MDISNKYCLCLGSVRGVLANSYCKSDEKIKYSIPQQQSEVTALEWGTSEDEIIVGYQNGTVDRFNILNNNYTALEKLEGGAPITGIGCVNNSVIFANEEGIINVKSDKNSSYFSTNLEEKASLSSMVCHNSCTNLVGTGGELNDFKLWDLETKQCIFKAKSLGHDELNLPIPTSIRGITFLSGSDNLSICATKEGHILLYDNRAQRKPVVKFLEKKASYTCIANAFQERQCLVGTTRGYMQLIDMKAPGKCLKTFTNFTGSVTGIVCDPVEHLVATSCLDRYLRVLNLETKEQVYKAYLKQSLTKIIMKPVVKEEEESDRTQEAVAEDVDEEYEELFNNMETVVEKDLSVKRKVKGDDKVSIKKKKRVSKTVEKI